MKKSVKLDAARLLGLRLERDMKPGARRTSKVGVKIGWKRTKVGAKNGWKRTKLGAKLGGKWGWKAG